MGKLPRFYDRDAHRHRHRSGNMFAFRKDWRRIATRYDRFADPVQAPFVFAAAITYCFRMQFVQNKFPFTRKILSTKKLIKFDKEFTSNKYEKNF